jgi:hypothetical protein
VIILGDMGGRGNENRPVLLQSPLRVLFKVKPSQTIAIFYVCRSNINQDYRFVLAVECLLACTVPYPIPMETKREEEFY